jgi:uncharacterized membrane protein
MKKTNFDKKFAIIILILLIIMTFATKFNGNTDVKDYSNVAKFFSGDLNSKIRSSHSYLYGFIHSPFVGLFENFLIFKITSLVSIFLIIISVYLISNKNKKALWLILASPISWYMAPWISPIQIATLFFLWSYNFIKKFDKENKLKQLFLSGFLAGISWAFWDGILFFIPLLYISFMYDKKLSKLIFLLTAILVGLIPRLLLDHFLFGFSLFGIIRHISASLTLTFLGGFYGQESLAGIWKFLLVLIYLPFFTYLMINKKDSKNRKKSTIFIILSIILLIINSQVRFVFLLFPIIILQIYDKLNNKQYFVQLLFFLIISLITINPYLIQITNDTNANSLDAVFFNLGNLYISSEFKSDILKEDLKKIGSEYSGEIFLVGNKPDSYSDLAELYWGSRIKELVSIQDYNLKENPIISQKEICTNTRINSRRDICNLIYIRKSFNDKTDYNSIKYAISEEENLNLEGFKLIKKYKLLFIFEKISN